MAQTFSFPRERVGKGLHKAGLSEMPFGYLLRDIRSAPIHGRPYELIMGGAGISVSILAILLVLLPGPLTLTNVGMAKISVAIALVSLAMLMIRNAARGNMLDTEIDFQLQEARLVRRSSRGVSRIETRVPFNQIRSIFVRRTKSRGSVTNMLCLRVAGGDAEITLMRGQEEAMSTLHRRLVRDINSVVLAGSARQFAAGPRALELTEAAEAARAGLTAA